MALPPTLSQCLPLERYTLLGISVSVLQLETAVDTMLCWIKTGQRQYAVVSNVYTLMKCQEEPALRSIVNNAGMVTPDGMPLVWLGRLLGFQSIDRVYGPNLLLAFSEQAQHCGYTCFLYGGEVGVAEELAAVLQSRFPALKIVGTYTPPFDPLTPDEEQHIIEIINAANPDVVWVGLGTPKQDYWVSRFRGVLNASVLIGIGAAFNIHTGRIPQAPDWMQRSGMEWLFRLMVEPRRLWKRYLIYNPLFIVLLLLEFVGLRRSASD